MYLLYPFQNKAVSWLKSKKRAVLGSELGTGKSAVAICSAAMLMAEQRLAWCQPIQTVVVCPSTVKGVWAQEIPKWCYAAKVQLIKTGKDQIDLNAEWIICSYDIFPKLNFPETPFILIFDESHYLKSIAAKRVQKILGRESMTRKVARVWFLTGTPFPDNLIDCWPTFAFCSYYRMGKYMEFAERYCYVRDSLWGKKITGCRKKMLGELVEQTRAFLHRDTVAAVLPELPDFQEEVVPLEPTELSLELEEKLAEYKEAVVAALSAEEGEPLEKKIPALSSLRRELGIEKVPQAAKFILSLLEQGEPVVVFAHHTNVVAGLVTELTRQVPIEKLGVIVGGVQAEERAKLVDAFQNGQKDCLILSIRAAGVGITLTRARVAVFVEEDWTPAMMEQARRRILRIGQKNFCLYYYLRFPDSFDEMVSKAVKAKAKNIDAFWRKFEGRAEAPPEPEQEEIVWD